MSHAEPRTPRRFTWTHAAAVSAGLLASALLAIPAAARDSDPIRNNDPEQPIPPDQIENPIYYTMPVGHAGDVTGVVPEALLQEFLNRHSSMDYPAAIEAAMRLVAAVPDRSIGYYNLACALARMQRTDEAIDALRSAVEHGWRDIVHTNIDPDLATLRNDPRFAEFRRDIDSRNQAERVTPTPLRTDQWQMVAAELNRGVPPLLARYHVPGAAVALIDNGQVVWSAAFGERDVRDEQSLSVDDRFRLRSPLHLLAIAACARLEQEQKLQLAALLVEAANEFAMPTLMEARGSGGVTTAGGVVQPANIKDSSATRDRRERANGVRMAMMGYSRHSVYGFLRLAIEDAADGPFPKYCEETIFPPAGVRQTSFAAPQQPNHAAVGHSALGTPLRPSVMEYEFAPGGSVHMTVGDLARLIASGMPPAGVGAGAAQSSHNPVFDAPADRPGVLANAIDIVTAADVAMNGSLGLAIKREQTADGVRMQIEESSSGIVLLARWHPQTRRGVVVLCNAVTGRGAAERIAHLALGGG